MRSVCLLIFCVFLTACGQAHDQLSSQDLNTYQKAIGLMGQYRYSEAEKVLSHLVTRHPENAHLKLDWAVALLNRQKDNDIDRAIELASALLGHSDKQVRARANYIVGILYLYKGTANQALPALQAAVREDGQDAFVHYFLAQALEQLGRTESALAHYEQACQRMPNLLNAWYGAAMVARKLGDRKKARHYLTRYQEVKKDPRSRLAEFKYTRMGPKAEVGAWRISHKTTPRNLNARLTFQPRLLASFTLDRPFQALRSAYVSDKRWIAAFEPSSVRIWQVAQQEFRKVLDVRLSGVQDVMWTDTRNLARPELLICHAGGLELLRERKNGWSAEKVSSRAKCDAALAIDWDHDGDIDIWEAAQGQWVLWRNLDDGGRFEPEVLSGVTYTGQPVVTSVDWDLDRDIDLLWSDRSGTLRWLENRLLEGPITHVISATKLTHPQWIKVYDTESDGRWEVLIGDDGQVVSWRPNQIETRPPLRSEPVTAWLDMQMGEVGWVNDAHGLRLVPVGEMSTTPVQTSPELQPIAMAPWFDLDGLALLTVESAGNAWRLALWQFTSTQFGPIGVELTGIRADDSVRSNALAIGTLLRMRHGEFWRSTMNASKNISPLVVRTDGQPLSLMEIRWPDGVFQTEMGLAPGQLHRVLETQRQLSSCPVVFIKHNGEFQFVSDVLGVGGIGFMLAPGTYVTPRPWEFFQLPKSLAPIGKREVTFEIAEPMEEVTYLDSARLHRWRLPKGWHMVIDERMGTGVPAPTGRPIFYRAWWSPLRATANDVEVTKALRERDGVAAAMPNPSRRYLGALTKPVTLTLQFPATSQGRYGLVFDGWVEYPYSQTLMAAHQAGVEYSPPTIEIYTNGQWKVWRKHIGYPAGMPRQAYFPLGALPSGVELIRIHTNMEIYWDSIVLVREEEMPRDVVHEVMLPNRAILHYIGFPKRTWGDYKRPQFDFSQRAPSADVKNLEGFYTRFGDVEALVREEDDALAIYGSGESLQLTFVSSTRATEDDIWVLEVRGYAKDMDLYTDTGGRIEPLPVKYPERNERERLHKQYNVRVKAPWGSQ